MIDTNLQYIAKIIRIQGIFYVAYVLKGNVMNYNDLPDLSSIQSEKERFSILLQSLHYNGNLLFAGQLLQRAAQLFAERCAIICRGNSVTYAELYAQACAVSYVLHNAGIKPHDRICIWFENSIDFYSAYYGAWQCGAVVVPLNVFLQQRELAHIIQDASPSLMLVSKKLKEKLIELPHERVPLILTEDDFSYNGSVDTNKEIPALDPDELAILLYTSGTTGLPKGVMLSSRNILVNMVQGAARFNARSDDRAYCPLPLFHSFAQVCVVWGSVFMGCSVILIPSITRRLLLEGLAHNPTIIIGVPALYGLFCMMKKLQFKAVRYFICGGDALPDRIREGFELLYRRRLCNGYGLTETSPLIALNIDDVLLPTNCVGKPVYNIEISLRDKSGALVAQGSVGELLVKGANVMQGYFNAPQLTEQVLYNGWFCTGDLARLDEKGRIIIVGRVKDLIINKGMNIYPQEIENVLLLHEKIMRAAVIGVPTEKDGEVPHAYVQSKDLDEQDEPQLIEWCRKHLAAYKVPRSVKVRKSLPLTSLAKVDKVRLKEEYEKI